MRHTRLISKRMETCYAEDGSEYYFDPETGASTYVFPTVLSYWGTLRKLGVVTGNGTVTGGGVELAGKSRRPYGYPTTSDQQQLYLGDDEVQEQVEESADPEVWEFVDGNPPYYYNTSTGESTYYRYVRCCPLRRPCFFFKMTLVFRCPPQTQVSKRPGVVEEHRCHNPPPRGEVRKFGGVWDCGFELPAGPC